MELTRRELMADYLDRIARGLPGVDELAERLGRSAYWDRDKLDEMDQYEQTVMRASLVTDAGIDELRADEKTTKAEADRAAAAYADAQRSEADFDELRRLRSEAEVAQARHVAASHRRTEAANIRPIAQVQARLIRNMKLADPELFGS